MSLHEMVTWPRPDLGDKYGRKIYDVPRWTALAKAYFVSELCWLVDPLFNVTWANNHRDDLLVARMEFYASQKGGDPLRVIRALQALASVEYPLTGERLITQPLSWIPRVLTFRDTDYPVLFPNPILGGINGRSVASAQRR